MTARVADPPARAAWPLALLGLILIALTAAGPTLHERFGGMAHWAIFALTAAGAGWAAVSSDRRRRRHALALIGAVAIGMRLALLFTDTYLSSDAFRYVWDGRVQAEGINPYRYVPAAPEIEALRDPTIFPRINRADYAPTIYPPAAQIFFLAVTRIGESVFVMKLGMLAFEALAVVSTGFILMRLGLPVTRLAVYVWHPLPVWEIAGNAHIDAMMIGLVMTGLAVFFAGRRLQAAALFALAVLAKPTALVALPATWRPWNLAMPAVFVAVAALLYLPYVSVGWRVFGFLPDYFGEEELIEGQGFGYLLILERLVGTIPDGALIYLVLAGAAMVGLALILASRADRSAPETVRVYAILAVAFLVLLTPHYPWYYLILVPLLAVYPGWWTLWVLTVGPIQMYDVVADDPLPDILTRQVVFHLAGLAAVVRDIVAGRIARVQSRRQVESS